MPVILALGLAQADVGLELDLMGESCCDGLPPSWLIAGFHPVADLEVVSSDRPHDAVLILDAPVMPGAEHIALVHLINFGFSGVHRRLHCRLRIGPQQHR